jgi:hypothetical protein
VLLRGGLASTFDAHESIRKTRDKAPDPAWVPLALRKDLIDVPLDAIHAFQNFMYRRMVLPIAEEFNHIAKSHIVDLSRRVMASRHQPRINLAEIYAGGLAS